MFRFFLLFFSCIYLNAEGVFNKYGILYWNAYPSGSSSIAVHSLNAQTNHLKSGKNILAEGEYQLIVRKKGYASAHKNIKIEAGDSKTLSISLTYSPFTLKLPKHKQPYRVFFNQNFILETKGPAILSNVPGGEHALFLLEGQSYLSHTLFSERLGSERVYEVKKPNFYSLSQRVGAATLLAVVPGFNYLVHFPERGRGVSLVLTTFFWTEVLAYSISLRRPLLRDSSGYKTFSSESLITYMVGTAILNVIHTYFTTLDDQINFVEEESGLKLEGLKIKYKF